MKIGMSSIEVVNAKLAILNIPYRITEDYGIKIIKQDIEELTIYEPVKYIPKKVYYLITDILDS